ncbi:MAG: hypothetical protein QXX12_02635 [Nanopusillaceae archaeon]
MQKVSVFWLSRPDSRLVSCLYKIRQLFALRFELGEITGVVNLKMKRREQNMRIISQSIKKFINVFNYKKIQFMFYTKYIKSLSLSSFAIF